MYWKIHFMIIKKEIEKQSVNVALCSLIPIHLFESKMFQDVRKLCMKYLSLF